MDILPLLLMFGLLGVMMYFMTRRQRRAQEQQMTLQNSLEVGDRVMTTSGLYGTVTNTDESATVTLDISLSSGAGAGAGAVVETEWLRAAIREKVAPVEETDDDDEVDVEDIVETVDADTNEPPAVKDDAELESGKKK
jgi:preprotein translocase subunit YajC